MSAPPADPKKRKASSDPRCKCCANTRPLKVEYCKRCQQANCAEYPGDCGHALIKPRYLARQQGQEHPEQYTTSASGGLPGEPATIDADALRQYAKEGRLRSEALRSRNVEAQPLSVRVAELERQARDGNAQARRQLFVIRQRVEAHERKDTRAA